MGTTLEGLCSALCGLLHLVHLTVTGRVFQKAPTLILVYKNWQRVTELNQFPQGLDVLLS